LKLWHPFIPFVTETIWKEMGNKNLLLAEKYPRLDNYKEIFENFNKFPYLMEVKTIQKIIVDIRNARSENVKIKAVIYTKIEKYKKLIEDNKNLIKNLKTGISELEIEIKGEKINDAISVVVGDIDIYLIGAIDKEKEKLRIKKEKDNLEKMIKIAEKKLANKEFVKKAPKNIVDLEKKRIEERKRELKNLNK